MFLPVGDDNSQGYTVIIMIRTQVSLEDDMYREAKKEARRQGISFAELCRRALAQLLRRGSVKEPWMRYEDPALVPKTRHATAMATIRHRYA